MSEDAWADKRALAFTREERREVRYRAREHLAMIVVQAMTPPPDDIPEALHSVWRQDILERAESFLTPKVLARALARARVRAEQ